jgi:hypothetical protein
VVPRPAKARSRPNRVSGIHMVEGTGAYSACLARRLRDHNRGDRSRAAQRWIAAIARPR